MYSTVNMLHMDTIGLWLGLKKNIQGFVCLVFVKEETHEAKKKKKQTQHWKDWTVPAVFLRFEGDPKIRSLRTFESFLGLMSWLLYNL